MYWLNKYRLFHYLMGRNGVGIIPKSVRSVGDNNYHSLFEAEWPDGRKWFIKQSFYLRGDERFSIINEATISYQISQISPLFGYVPSYIYYDRVNNILITDYFPDNISLSRNTSIPLSQLLMNSALPEAAGKMMASFHIHLTAAAKTSVNGPYFYFLKPPFLVDNIAFLNSILQNESVSSSQRSWLLPSHLHSQISEVLFDLSQSWKPDYIIHGDAVFDNILVRLNGEIFEKVQLCDWEFAGWGDPDWDSASFFQGLLIAYMDMRINHAILLEAGRQYYTAYMGVYPTATRFSSFDIWFVRILRFAAINLLERLVISQLKTVASDNQTNGFDARVEFLLTRVLINSHLLKQF